MQPFAVQREVFWEKFQFLL